VFRQLLQVGVRAVRVPEGTPILVLLNQLQQHWDAPHLAHVKPPRDPQRFASLANETQWQDED
jgi:nitrogen fixation protein NifX